MDIGTLLFAATALDLQEKASSSANSSLQGATEVQLTGNSKDNTFSKALKVMATNSAQITSDAKEQTQISFEESAVVVNNQMAMAIMQILTEDKTQEVEEFPEEAEKLNSKASILVPEKQAEDSVKALTDKANAISQELAKIKQFVQISNNTETNEKENTVDAKELFASKLVVVKSQDQAVSFKQENVKSLDNQQQKTNELTDEIIENVLTKDVAKEQSNAKTLDIKNTQTVEVKPSTAEFKTSLDENVDLKSEQIQNNTSNIGLSNLSKEFNLQRIDAPKEPISLVETKEIVDNLVAQAKLTQKPGISEMVIRLRPQHLGDMTIRIMTENTGAVTASFHSNNPEVRAIIQEALPAIRQELSNTGLKVNDVGVYAGLNEQNFGQQNQNQGQYDQVIENTRKLSKEEKLLLEELQALHGENQNIEGGVDYRV